MASTSKSVNENLPGAPLRHAMSGVTHAIKIATGIMPCQKRVKRMAKIQANSETMSVARTPF